MPPYARARPRPSRASGYLAGTILALNDAEKADALRHAYTAAEYDSEMADLLYDRRAVEAEVLSCRRSPVAARTSARRSQPRRC